MKYKVLFFLSFILLAGTSNLSARNNSVLSDEFTKAIDSTDGDIITHTVAKGETVYSIASAYQIAVKDIYRLNSKAEKGIKTGDKLKIEKVKQILGYSNHLIESKETLYSVSKMYNISVGELESANQGLDEKSFKKGKSIRIPKYGTASNQTVVANSIIEYKVQKGETLYSIGKSNNVSVEVLIAANPGLKNGLKDGTTLMIPKKQDTDLQVINRQEVMRAETPSSATKGETMRIGILFPFLDEKSSVQKEKLAEYYQGFLLAVKELKEKNLNAEIYTFDIGTENDTKKLESLLGTSEMTNLHLVIGGVSKQQINTLTKFSKNTGVKYIIPFGSSAEMESSRNIYQMTTSHASLYPEIVTAFARRFDDYNIILVSGGAGDDKSDFTGELKKELTKLSIQFKSISSSGTLSTELKKAIDPSKKNILVPSSSSEASLNKIVAAAGKQSVSFYGYPEWQTYANQVSNLHKYDTYIYSIFFLNENENNAQNFINDYKKWYNTGLLNSFPKFGCLGYDTGLYFLTAMNKYGTYFDSEISTLRVPTIQSSIRFKQVNNKGGYINNGVYFVHYKTDSSIEKIDVSN